MFRNEEFKSLIFKLLIMQLVFAVFGFIIINLFIDNINRKILIRDMSMVGSLVREFPELENQIVHHITKETTRENQALGESILSDYGYNLSTSKNQQPILKNVSPHIQVLMSGLVLSFFIPLFLLLMGEYRKIYKKVNEVSAVAEKVVEGDFSVNLKEEGEGDFYILNHQINQMANRLENTLDRLNREKVFLKDTISDISHQLKTPLSSLIMLNDLLLEDKDMDKDTRKGFLEKSMGQLQRMEWLIINLLKLARIEAGAIKFKKEKVFLKDVLDIALKTLELSLSKQDIRIEGDMESSFNGDIDWTSEALINIIKNAAEHSRGKISIRLEDTPLFSTIVVMDNGEGIDRRELPNVFKRFYKSQSETKADSIGIGLNLAKLIVESQEGTIGVKSTKGLATEFTITFLKS